MDCTWAHVEGLVPAPGVPEHKAVFRSCTDRIFIYVNNRPVNIKALTRMLKQITPCGVRKSMFLFLMEVIYIYQEENCIDTSDDKYFLLYL